MAIDIEFTLIALGMFFFAALGTGVWKYAHMISSPDHQAPAYVNVAHHAALHYSFAILIILEFLEHSAFPASVNLAAAAALIAFFAIATLTYIMLGARNQTDNQFRERTAATTWGMYALIAVEFGGFAVLFTGFLVTLV